ARCQGARRPVASTREPGGRRSHATTDMILGQARDSDQRSRSLTAEESCRVLIATTSRHWRTRSKRLDSNQTHPPRNPFPPRQTPAPSSSYFDGGPGGTRRFLRTSNPAVCESCLILTPRVVVLLSNEDYQGRGFPHL